MADDPYIDSALRLALERKMPEAYDRRNGELVDQTVFDPRPYLHAFGAGVADPAGIPSTLLDMALRSTP